MTPLIKALGDWGMAHVQHLKELYGEERSMEPFEVKEEISGA